MKNLLATLLCALIVLASTCIVTAQNEYGTISLLLGTKSKNQRGYKIYFNDKLVSSAVYNQTVHCKILSEGRISVSIVDPLAAYDPAASGQVSVEISNGKHVYVGRNPFKVKNARWHVCDSTDWVEMSTHSTDEITVEENTNDPWGRIDHSKKSGKGQATCFLISSAGYLITNYHVVENAKEITVKGVDGDFTTKYGATVVGIDQSNDLALIKLGNKNLKFTNPPFAVRSSGVAQGEKVYAMGFPIAKAMGDEMKLTEGIISAKSGVGGNISNFQISAAVNSGNSGGPLIDEQGNLIGVIYAKSTIADAANYAVKASYVESFLKNIESFDYPILVNTIKEQSLTEKVAQLKNYIFIVETN